MGELPLLLRELLSESIHTQLGHHWAHSREKKKKAGKAFRQLWLGLHTQHQVLTDAARANLLARREVRERAYPYPKPTACCKACFFLPEGLQSRSA